MGMTKPVPPGLTYREIMALPHIRKELERAEAGSMEPRRSRRRDASGKKSFKPKLTWKEKKALKKAQRKKK